MMASKQEYSQLPPYSEDSLEHCNDQDENQYANKTLKFNMWSCIAIAIAFGLLVGSGITCAIYTGFHYVGHHHNNFNAQDVAAPSEMLQGHDVNEHFGLLRKPNESDPICGNNHHEARRNGCRFDVMASRWFPTGCYHEDVLEQMLSEVDFNWYEDPEHQRQVGWDTALSGDHDRLFPLHNYHIMHCLYGWRRLHMAVIKRRQIDDDVFSYAHTVHCTKLIMQWPKEWKYGKNTTTTAPSGMAYCIPPFL